MENRQLIRCRLAFVGALLLLPLFSSAYQADTTHPALTSEIVDFFNYYNEELSLSEDEKMLVVKGSIDEDRPAKRVVNHFFDPVFNKGLTQFGGISSKEWVKDTNIQARFLNLSGIGIGATRELFNSNADYTWDRAIYEYVHGDKDRALLTLGHVLHLLEDLTVPPHVRDDPHPPAFDFGSPYEAWTGQFNIDNINIIEGLVGDDIKPTVFSTLDLYFTSLAKRTNSNFFSKDTFSSNKYSNPKVILEVSERLSDGRAYTFGYGSMGQRLIRVRFERDKITGESTSEYRFNDIDNLIMADYWGILSKQAVKYCAGVIELFFDEVEKERQTFALYDKNKSSLSKFFTKVASAIQRKSPSDNLVNIASPTVALEDEDERAPEEPITDVSATDEEAEESIVEVNEDVVEEVEEILIVEDNEVVVEDEIIVEEENTENSGITEPKYSVPGTFFGGGGGGVVSTEETSNELDESESSEVVTESATLSPDEPGITSPSDLNQTFATTTITFVGTTTPSTTVSTDFSTATTSVDTNGDWTLELTDLSQGTTTIQFIATNSGGHTATTSISIGVDSEAPTVDSFSVLECTYSLSSSVCLSGGTTVNLAFSSNSLDVYYYEIVVESSVASTTVATSTTAVLTDGATSSVEVVVYDAVGNSATSTSQSVKIITTPVVINEIAWAGTEASSTDEWIELYNRSGETLDLSNTVLESADGVPYLELSGKLSSEGYYLIERTDDNATSIAASLTSVFSGIGAGSGLSNTVEQLYLSQSLGGNATTTLDSTPSTSSCSGLWCAGTTDSSPLSMERKDPDVSGTDTTNWANNNTFTKNGNDADGNSIKGTPGSQNSVNLPSIGYFCPPETSTFTSGGYYIPSSGACTYLSSEITGNRYGDLYRGTVASSTIVNGHSLGTSVNSTQNGDDISNPIQGEDFFVAIYEVRTGPAFANDLADFRDFFQTSISSLPHLNYGVLEWKYGVEP